MWRSISIVFAYIIANFSCASAQEIDSVYFRLKEKMLIDTYNKIVSSTNKKSASHIFLDSLTNILKHPEARFFAFDSIKTVGRIVSPDNNLVVFTWNVPEGTYHNYFGVVLYHDKKQKNTKVYTLTEEIGKLNRNPQSPADTKHWAGALYYEVVATKHKGQVYYTLIGFNFNNLLSNFKVIEVLAFDKMGVPNFPQRMFMYNGKVQNRVVFEYAERAVLTVKYAPNNKAIVFDHLSPFRPSLEGQYQYYGPDFSFDALRFKDGHWFHESDIEMKN